MAPNPVIIPRHQSSPPLQPKRSQRKSDASAAIIILTILTVPLATLNSWSTKWITSGAAVESLLLVYASLNGALIPRRLDLCASLAALNVSFALSSTSWLLHPAFTAACYPAILLTCLSLFPAMSSVIRKGLRRLIPQFHFFQDKIGLFKIPALHIDTQVSGLFVVRGITVSLLDLRIDAYGLEVGLRLHSGVELALATDYLSVELFRRIKITEVYGNIKVRESESTVDSSQIPENDPHYMSRDENGTLNDSIAKVNNQDYIRANGPTSSSTPSRVDATNAEDVQDVAAAIPSDDSEAERRYNCVLEQIKESSQIDIARREIAETDRASQPSNEREMRQAVCAKLQEVPAVSHTPAFAVRVSVLQTIYPRTRRFLHRLPLLLRLLLNGLSHFHPIHISSVSIAGPGERLKGLLEDYLIKDQASHDADIKELQEEMSTWLEGASFCLEVADVASLAHVPLSAAGEITAYLRCANVSLYRTPLNTNTVLQVCHIGGVDGTIVIPSFLLPHHEHCLPPLPGENGRGKRFPTNSEPNGAEPLSDADYEDSEGNPDETEMTVSAHASLPTHFDQSVLDFASSLVKATKLIDLENLFEREYSKENSSGDQSNAPADGSEQQSSAAETNASSNAPPNDQSKTSSSGTESNLSKLASRARQTVKDGIKKGVKKNAVGDKVNDRWIAKTVGRIAARLEEAQGDFGYTTSLPLSLQPYRVAAESTSKLLP